MTFNHGMRLTRPLAGSVLLLALACSGCQTFNLTKEEWEKQQKGGTVDHEVGAAVGVLGTLGYFGAAVGQIAAKGLK